MRRALLPLLASIALSSCAGSPPPAATPTHGPVLSKEKERTPMPPTPPPLPVPPPLPLVDFDVPWPTVSPEEVGLVRADLEKTIRECEKTGTDALLVLSGDRAVVARTFGHAPRPLDTKSVTKGFAGVAIGFLVAEGKLRIDDPLSTWFPEWKQGKKAKVLLRHVLTHTSGLSHEMAAGKLERQRDRVAYVRGLDLVTEPGAAFSYNNEASMLLSAIIAKATGEPIDTYLARRLFEPLGIQDVSWQRDDAGNITTNSGLTLSAVSLAKVGLALRDGRIVPPAWITSMQEPAKVAPWMGLMTWIVEDGPWQVQDAQHRAQFEKNGFAAQVKLAPLDGKRYRSRAAYWMEAGALLTPDERTQMASMIRDDLLPFGEIKAVPIGYHWNGWLGQYLVVLPKARLVAVRQRSTPAQVDDDTNKKVSVDLVGLVRAAAGM